MKNKTKAATLLSLLAFVATPISSLGAPVPDEQYQPQEISAGDQGYLGSFIDDSGFSQQISILWGSTGKKQWETNDTLCKDVNDNACRNGDFISYNAVLPVCSDIYRTDCINYVKFISREGKETKGKFTSYFPRSYASTFKGDPTRGFPSGVTPSVWTFDDHSHNAGNKYLAIVSLVNFWSNPNEKPRFQTLNADFYPISIEPYRFTSLVPGVTKNSNGDFQISIPSVKGSGCTLYVGEGECAQRQTFPEDFSYEMQLKLSYPLSGWLHGRIQKPNVSVVTDADQNQIITVRAEPMRIPIFYIWKKFNELPIDFQNYFSKITDSGLIFTPNWRDIWVAGGGVPPWNKLNILRVFGDYKEASFSEYLNWLKISEDKAIATKSAWSFKSLGDAMDPAQQTCISREEYLAGLVSTNATMYIASPPNFNQITQTLDYKVSSPHYDKNGKENIGQYNLAIKSSLARCLYGFTQAPIQASVSVVDSSGTERISTSSISEKDGWLNLSVTGFTYSAPTLKVKLTQESSSLEHVDLSKKVSGNTVLTAATSKKSITCYKGKLSKKISGTNPKCPTGYKKK